jgi:hypothetical protein
MLKEEQITQIENILGMRVGSSDIEVAIGILNNLHVFN